MLSLAHHRIDQHIQAVLADHRSYRNGCSVLEGTASMEEGFQRFLEVCESINAPWQAILRMMEGFLELYERSPQAYREVVAALESRLAGLVAQQEESFSSKRRLGK